MIRDGQPTSKSIWKTVCVGFAQAGGGVALAAAIDLLICPFPTPYPLVLLVAVYASYRGGLYQGLPSVIVMFGFALLHDSMPGRLFRYDLAGEMRVLMSAGVPISIVVMMELLRHNAEIRGRLGERAVADSAARQKQIEQQILFDSVPAMIWFKDRKGTILRANKPAARSIGRSVGDVEGRPTHELYPEQAPNYQRDDQEVIESGRPKLGIVERYEIPTGEERWVLTDKLPYRDGEGNVLGVIVFAVDITDQKRTEEALKDAHDQLERRVLERTEELKKLNDDLRHEVAERQRSENALRASETRFRTMGETIAAAAFIYQGTKLLDMNPAAERITGYRRDELIGDDFWKVIHPDHRKHVTQQGMARQRGEAVPSNYEVKILRKDGGVRWVDVTVGLMEINGQPAVLGTAYDNTDRKLVEDALRDSEERFRLLFEQAAAGIAHVSLEGRFLNVNRRLCNMLGCTREELLELRFADVTHPDHVKQDLDAAALMLSGDSTSYTTEKRYLHKDGTPVWVHLTASLVRGPSNEPKYFVSVTEDIGERIRAQDALRESEQRLQAILDYTTAVIYVKDLDGKYLLINRRFEELFHISRQAILGCTDYDFFPKDAADAFRANDRRVLEAGSAMELEEIAPQDDGVHFYISVKFPILGTDGKPRALCGISTDITERKRNEGELRKAKDAAEQANRAKSRFLANISHEIRTPIMAMLGAAELVRAGDLGPAKLRDRGEVILRNGRHLLALIDDLLAQSSLESGRLEVAPAECSLLEIMADVHAVTSPLRRQRAVDFQMIYETSVPEWILTDRTRLTQAIVNLVHNALKFTLRGFVRVRVRAEPADGEIMLTVVVEDSGGGIAPSDLGRIFEPFTQVGPVSVGASAGVGLGLSLAKWIAGRLGGRLDAASEVGLGSTFTLRVPVGPAGSTAWIDLNMAAQLSPAPFVADATRYPSLHGSVLLAEDSEDVREMMAEALERAGAEVVRVADGSAAVEAARRRSFDLILLDIRMPVMDGMEAARQLRRNGCRSIVIALTASAARTMHPRILDAGFDDLWPKPISLERLVEEASAFLPDHPRDPSPDPGAEKQPDDRAFNARRDSLADAAAEFVRSLNLRAARLRAAIAGGDQQQARDILHQLVGSAGVYGFMELSAQAASLSAEIKKGVVSLAAPEYRRLQELIDSTLTSVAG